jgi:DNA-binding response OmpR family regulator
MRRILIIEDENNIRDVCRRYLEREGFEVLEAGDGDTGWEMFQEHTPDLVVMDLMLPNRDGYQLCQDIRREADTPVIMLTARGDERDRVMGLTLGADDYVTKPFSPRELILRIQNIFRRMSHTTSQNEEQESSVLRFGDVVIDADMRRVTVAFQTVDLTVKEFDVLYTMASRPGSVFSKGQLLELVWGYDSEVDTSAVAVLIRRLREKIEANPSHPQWIHTVWGIGYRFEWMGVDAP